MIKHVIDIQNMSLSQKVLCCVDKIPHILEHCTECINLYKSDIEYIVDHKGALYIYEFLDDGSLDSLLQSSQDLWTLLSNTKAVLVCITSKKEISVQLMSNYIEFIEEHLQDDTVFTFGTSLTLNSELKATIKITIVFVH